MKFSDIEGNEAIKQKLIRTVKDNRISHALMFFGPEGCGKLSMAIAYAQYISCTDKQENDSCGKCASCRKFEKLIHPDLHFVYPVVRTPKFSKPVSDDFLPQWRDFVLKSSYHSLDEWMELIGSDKLQGSIYAQESKEIIRKLNLKTFEGEYKFMIIWMAEKMNITAANKLLKMIEEPPSKTLFILVAENQDQIITTIRSRTQPVKFLKLSQQEIFNALSKELPDASKQEIDDVAKVSEGNFIKAKNIIMDTRQNNGSEYFSYFANLMRYAYAVKILDIIDWVEDVAKWGREKQKSFFEYSLRMIRENFVLTVTQGSSAQIVFLAKFEEQFSEKFHIFIHEKNVELLMNEFTAAFNHIQRNASAKIVLLDMALKIVKYLKIKRN